MLIQDLIVQRMEQLGLDRRGLGLRMSGHNKAKLFRQLDRALVPGEYSTRTFCAWLATALELGQPLVVAAYMESLDFRAHNLELRIDADRADEERRLREMFKPHLWVIPERETTRTRAQGLRVAIEAYRRVDLPATMTTRPHEKQKFLVKARVQQHLEATQGRAGPFGAICGYRYYDTYDSFWEVDTCGELGARRFGPRSVRDSYTTVSTRLALQRERAMIQNALHALEAGQITAKRPV